MKRALMIPGLIAALMALIFFAAIVYALIEQPQPAPVDRLEVNPDAEFGAYSYYVDDRAAR